MAVQPHAPFSSRNRGSQPAIDNTFPTTARIGLLHIVRIAIEKQFIGGWIDIANELERIGRKTPGKYSTRYLPDFERAETNVESLLEALPWEKVLDFCERLHGSLAREVGHAWGEHDEWITDTPRSEVQKELAAEIEQLFVEENLAFEFRDGAVFRKGRKHTVDVATRADQTLRDLRLENARKHFGKALRYFREPVKPDPENAVKEAVCAVEAAARELFPDIKGTTLDDVVKGLMGNEPGKFPKPLGQTFLGLYGYRNGGDGVAHGGASAGPAIMEIAEYAIAVAASQIIFLSDLFTAQEDDIPF